MCTVYDTWYVICEAGRMSTVTIYYNLLNNNIDFQVRHSSVFSYEFQSSPVAPPPCCFPVTAWNRHVQFVHTTMRQRMNNIIVTYHTHLSGIIVFVRHTNTQDYAELILIRC